MEAVDFFRFVVGRTREQIFMFKTVREAFYACVYVADSHSYAVEGNLRMLWVGAKD